MHGPNLTCNNKTNIVKSIKQMDFVCTETKLVNYRKWTTESIDIEK